MKGALVGASLVLLYSAYWMVAAILIILTLKLVAHAHDTHDCLSWVENDNYVGTEEGEYF